MRNAGLLLSSMLLIIGVFSFAQEDYRIDSLKNKVKESASKYQRYEIYHQLGNLYHEINSDSSIHFLKKALEHARELELPSQKAKVYLDLGHTYCFMGEYLKSLEYLDLAENIVNEHPDLLTLANINSIKSIVFISIHRFESAIKSANIALKIYTELENPEKLCLMNTIFSNIYYELGNIQKSIDYAKHAYRISEELKDTLAIASMLNNLGYSYYKNGNYDSAYAFIREAIDINKKINLDKSSLAVNYMNLAIFKLKDREVDSAYFYAQTADNLFQEIGYLYDYNSMMELKAEIALAGNDTGKAIELYNSIVNSSSELENLKVRVDAYKALAEISHSMGKLNEAYAFYKSYKLFDDSLKKESNTSLLNFMELEMEYEKKHNQLALENKEVKIKSQKKNIYLIIAAGIIILLIISGYFILKVHKVRSRAMKVEKKRVEDELKFKNREMTANVMSLMKKNEMLASISKELLSLEKMAVNPETKNAMRKIAAQISKTREVELWEEFDIRFKQVQNDFYVNLLKQFPDLSPSEQRLCAFLKMNMSTKDISELTGTSPRSVDTARYRVRKKLGLTSDDNLVGFLSKI